MKFSLKRFPFLNYPLDPLAHVGQRIPANAKTRLHAHLREARYSIRLLRYWWAGQALKAESERLGRPLCVVDLGCERGWLKHFTPKGAVSKWIGLDWNPQPEVRNLAQYNEVHHANFDEHLPVESAIADAVVSLHVFEHLLRPGSTMAEVSRVLKPGGIFLAGAPTMPHWLAKRREKHFRRLLQQGKLAAGGHITVLSPDRWKSLAADAGMQVEFATGSHAIRRTGSVLENSRLWVRLNQLWGGLFPSLGSECYTMARRDETRIAQSDRLGPEDPHRRSLWITVAATASAIMLGLGTWGILHAEQHDERQVSKWLDAHQSGSDKFILHDKALGELCDQRTDVHCTDSLQDLVKVSIKSPDAHILVSIPTAHKLIGRKAIEKYWRIDSRLDLNGTDYLLLRRRDEGTPLKEYLLGAN